MMRAQWVARMRQLQFRSRGIRMGVMQSATRMLKGVQLRQEAGMRNGFHNSSNSSAGCCAICGGRFGLIRYYCWRTALCSRKCVDRLKARQVANLKWLNWPRVA